MTHTYYDLLGSCNKCGLSNCEVEETHREEGTLYEALNKCLDCGYEGFWAFGFYENEMGQQFIDKCDKYYFDHENGGGFKTITREEYLNITKEGVK